jgi:hypothetical protein
MSWLVRLLFGNGKNHPAAEAFGREVKRHLSIQLIGAGFDKPCPKTATCRLVHPWTATFCPAHIKFCRVAAHQLVNGPFY